ncbi:LexA family protein [Symbiobacterium terraclitae]|uniref:LexA family protein n=1 Tax=Symbiobacterium terraclitae TaxID=557451 RepID=UPI0035B51F1F
MTNPTEALIDALQRENTRLTEENRLLRQLMDLTPAQRRVLEVIIALERENGYAPTVREIARRAGLSSTATVQGHLRRLLEAGHIRRASRRVGYTVRGLEHANGLDRPGPGRVSP